MSTAQVTVVGVGAGGPDSLTVGVLRRLREAAQSSVPVIARTLRHPTFEWLRAEGVVVTESFDALYEQGADFESVYRQIARSLVERARRESQILYAVPGDPSLGERSVSLLRDAARDASVRVEVIGGASAVEPALAAAGIEAASIRIVDALTVPDVTDQFRFFSSPFSLESAHLVYQLYDRHAATRVKLALLEHYPPEFGLLLIRAAGIPEAERVERVALHQLDHLSHEFDHLTSVVVPAASNTTASTHFVALLDVMARLRNPVTGCPWDREQTPQTIKKYLIEEAYEVVEAIESENHLKVVEELGDLLLQVVFHAQLAREAGDFEIEDVIQAITEKLIRRHPHVFGTTQVADSDEVLKNWETIKRGEPGYEDRTSRLDGVPNHLPALMRAQEISKRAAKAGFEWETIAGVFAKLDEEIAELHEALESSEKQRVADELGDLLFTVVNLARFAKVDAEEALRTMVGRFGRRFRGMEIACEHQGRSLEELNQVELEGLWQDAKREESSH